MPTSDGNIVTTGVLTAAVTAAFLAGGDGQTLGQALARWVEGDAAERFTKLLAERRLLLWVRSEGGESEEKALALLSALAGTAPTIHALRYRGRPLSNEGGERP